LRIDGIKGAIHAVVGDGSFGHEKSWSRHAPSQAKSGLRGDFIEWGGGKPISWQRFLLGFERTLPRSLLEAVQVHPPG
jgi:hypothetical protein